MRIVLAVERWGPAHTGSTGRAWWLAHGLSARGHRIEVIAAGRSTDDVGRIRIRALEATWPSTAARHLALIRARSAGGALPEIQREILGRLGASSDPAGVDFRGVDGVIGMGLRSPHVRALVARAAGRVPIMLHLGAGDGALAAMPVVRLSTRRHVLVASSTQTAEDLCTRVGRRVEVIPPGADPKAPNPRERTSRAVDRAPADGTALVITAGPAPSEGHLARVDPECIDEAPVVDACRSVGLRAVAIGLRELAVGRVDDMVERSRVVVLMGGDAGDLPGLAMHDARPLVACSSSSGASEIDASGAGWVVGDLRAMTRALAEATGDQGGRRGALGVAFAAAERSWDQLAPRLEALIEGAGPVNP